MPKIRGIKPDYWTDEDIVDLTIAARLLFIGLWSYACDNGHLQDKPKQIKMRIFPGDDVNAAELLRELAASGRITRAGGWITVPNFTKHQKPDKRYFQTCDAPDCTRPEADSQPETRGGHVETTTRPQRAHDVVSQGPRGDGEGDGDSEGEGDRARAPRKRAARLPSDYQPTPEHVALSQSLGINLDYEFTKFRDYWLAEGKTKTDWDATLRNWLRRASENFTGRPQAPVKPRVLTHARDIEQPPDGLTPEEYAVWDQARRARRGA